MKFLAPLMSVSEIDLFYESFCGLNIVKLVISLLSWSIILFSVLLRQLSEVSSIVLHFPSLNVGQQSCQLLCNDRCKSCNEDLSLLLDSCHRR